MAHHLTMQEREIISQMRCKRFNQAAIARRLGRHPSTISREIARNGHGVRYYSAWKAQAWSEQRRRERPLERKLDRAEVREEVCRGLSITWSPDQISGWLRKEHPRDRRWHLSPQTIYTWIKRPENRSRWEQCLRFGGRRRLRRDRRGKIPRTVEIDRRPAVVSRRSRFGDWEGDTVMGLGRWSAVVTHVERKSGYLLAAKLEACKAKEVNRASKRLFAKLPPRLRKTLTLDNGKEFASHEELARLTGLAIYFAKPYSAWQRGTNENTNGLFRQFFPKGTDFRQVTQRLINHVVELINNRPRKRLGYRTPNEVLPHHKCCI
jgi:IS30 family transposase